MSSNNPVTPPPEESGSERSILTTLQGGGEQSVMPDLGGVNPSTVKSKFKVHSQTLVIALVLAASGASLYTMRKQGMGSGMVFKNIKVEYDIEKGRPVNDAQQQRILGELARSQENPQVPLEKIPKNPFQLDSAGPATTTGAPIDQAALSEALRRQHDAEREQAIRTAIAGLDVGSIMQGPTPLARINGRIVREGDSVSEVLKVKAIHDRAVEFEADGKLFVVNMSENTTGKGRGPLPRK